jgi:predicted O-linked N-acetylglucosamine transferase (SPINDLY family)
VSAGVLAQASALLSEGRLDQARALLQRGLAKDPGDAGLNNLMARLCMQSGEPARAVYFLERVAAARPQDAPTLGNLGAALHACGQTDRAEEVLRRALASGAEHPGLRHVLWDVLMHRQQVAEAAEVCRRGLERAPGNAMLTVDLAMCVAAMGRPEEAVAALRSIADANPNLRALHEALPYYMNYAPGVEPALSLEAHQRLTALTQRGTPDDGWRFPGTIDPERRLRVGVLSSDLRHHSVGFFALALFEGLDPAGFELIAYSLWADEPDALGRRLASRCAHWRRVGHLPGQDLIAAIRADRVDVLLELNGLTLGGRLAALARRAAPVQCSYLGYPASTGVPTIDWRIVDSRTDPPGAEAFASERLWRLDPCFLCFTPPEPAPDPASPHAGPDGPAFASFNALQKLNAPLVSLWARLLTATPGSTLRLKNKPLTDPLIAADVRARFAAAGVDPARIITLPWAGTNAQHLASYSGVSLALDTFPYHGTTTTCEALFMGVPVVTLAGDEARPRHASRVGVSLLSACGLDAWIARDEDGYIAIAQRLAADPGTMRGRDLRQRFLASPVCDRAGYAQRLGGALRGMWADRCTREAGT